MTLNMICEFNKSLRHKGLMAGIQLVTPKTKHNPGHVTDNILKREFTAVKQ